MFHAHACTSMLAEARFANKKIDEKTRYDTNTTVDDDTDVGTRGCVCS